MRIHAYVRTSHSKDQTTQQQKDAIVASLPADAQVEFFEEQLSGWKGKRPEYDLLKKLIARGSVKELVVFSISRLGRNVQEAAALMTLCQQRNVRVRVLCENLDFSGPFGFALYTLFAALAQMDSDMKSMHTRAALDMKKEKEGWQCHGSPPDCVARKVKEAAEEVYTMVDAGKSQRYVAKTLHLMEHTVTKIVRLRGKEMLTREEYAARFPGWHLMPREEMPRLIGDKFDYPVKKSA